MSITLREVSVEVSLEVDITCKCGNTLSVYRDPSRGSTTIIVQPCEDCLQELKDECEGHCEMRIAKVRDELD